MSGFPTDPEALSLEWLNTVLDGTSHKKAGPITAFSWEPIGTGQVGDTVRISLEHAGGASSVAAKFPAADPASCGTAAMMGLYAKEVQFYRDIAPSLAMRSPKVYAAEVSEEGSEFVLLFEDLGPARAGDQIAGCSLEDARLAMAQAAAFHAPSWHNEALLVADWLAPRPELLAQIAAMYAGAQKVFHERYADSLEPEYMALCEEVAALDGLFAQRSDPPQCVVHGDFRLDNMLFDICGGSEPAAILDWQTVTTGKAMSDIGYFLGCGIGDELRRAYEAELLDLYFSEMEARGVTLDREGAWHEYRVGALQGVTTAVFSAAFVERTERGDANFLSMARGACALALEHNSVAAFKRSS